MILPAACSSRSGEQEAAWMPEAFQPSPDAKTFVYDCAEGFQFAAYLQKESAWLFMPQKTVSLPRVSSGSGDKYSDGKILFWSRDQEALLEIAEDVQYSCINNPLKAVWEHARLTGVDFRAVGNEPGWNLDIYDKEKIVLVTDYGQARYEFAAPEPEFDQRTRTTLYRIQDQGHDLAILIEDRPCQDTMSGEVFEVTVNVTLDDRTLMGCGRSLR